MLDYFLAYQSMDWSGQYQAIHQVVSLAPNPKWTLRLASTAAWTNRPREALELLTRLESERDWLQDDPGYLLVLIDVKLMLGDYEGALVAIGHAQALPGEFIAIIPKEVEALARLGRVDEAAQRSIQHLESTGNPGTHDLWSWLPMVLRGAGLDDQARHVAEVSVASLRKMERSQRYVLPKALYL